MFPPTNVPLIAFNYNQFITTTMKPIYCEFIQFIASDLVWVFSFDWNPWVESRSRHTIFFFNESLCRATLENIGREVVPQRFLFQSKSASHAEVAPLCFYFRTHFPFSRYRRGQRSRHVLFSLHIRHPTRATRERNSTAPAPFSPSLLDCALSFATRPS